MRLLMKETRRGSPNGVDVNRYLEGEEYDLPETLANVFIGNGWAEEVELETEEDSEEDESEDAQENDEEVDLQEGSLADEWEGKLGPYDYLTRWPDGPSAELAKNILEEQGKDLPEDVEE